MITPDVEKYLEAQFANELTAEEVVDELVKGGWRESDAKTVVRQYETQNILEKTPPIPPKEKKIASQKIDFSKIDSHGKRPDVEIGKDFVPIPDPQNTAEKPQSVQEQKEDAQALKQSKAEALLSAHVDMNASYDDLTMNLSHSQDSKDIHRNNTDKIAETYEEPATGFSPLDLKKNQEKHEENTSEKSASKENVQFETRKGKFLGTLIILWIFLIGILVGLYFVFVKSTNTQDTPRSVQEVTSTSQSQIPQIKNGFISNATCGNDINCFVLEGSQCLSLVTVEKVRVSSFFASQQEITSLLEVVPDEENCIFKGKILSVKTEVTGDVAEVTRRNVEADDQSLVGLEGFCTLSKDDIVGFLTQVREGSLTDLDLLSAECEGDLFENKGVIF